MRHANRVCEMCLDAAGEDALAETDERELLCLTLGADIADHLCEEIESDGAVRCRCACHEGAKRELRRKVHPNGSRR